MIQVPVQNKSQPKFLTFGTTSIEFGPINNSGWHNTVINENSGTPNLTGMSKSNSFWGKLCVTKN
jgi:hypothetical protein